MSGRSGSCVGETALGFNGRKIPRGALRQVVRNAGSGDALGGDGPDGGDLGPRWGLRKRVEEQHVVCAGNGEVRLLRLVSNTGGFGRVGPQRPGGRG